MKCPNCGYCPHCGRKDAAAPRTGPFTQPHINPMPQKPWPVPNPNTATPPPYPGYYGNLY